MMLSTAGVGFTDHRLVMERPLTERGLPKRSYGAVKMITARLVFLLILPSLSICAPQASQVQITSSDGTFTPELADPFGSGEDNRRLLQSYIKSHLKEGQTSPELNTREQEVFFLFSLYDYDRSGQMDGLELMQLLTDFLSYHAIMPKSTDYVVSLVDYLLQSQDLNQDGLLVPSELLSSSTLHHEEENNIVTPDTQAEPVKTNKDQMDIKTEKTHQEEAEIHDTQESEQKQDELVEHNEPQEPAQEPTDLNQVPETLQEHQDGIQSPDEKLQDEHQE